MMSVSSRPDGGGTGTMLLGARVLQTLHQASSIQLVSPIHMKSGFLILDSALLGRVLRVLNRLVVGVAPPRHATHKLDGDRVAVTSKRLLTSAHRSAGCCDAKRRKKVNDQHWFLDVETCL